MPISLIITYPNVIITVTATIEAGIPFLKKSDGSRYLWPISSSTLILRKALVPFERAETRHARLEVRAMRDVSYSGEEGRKGTYKPEMGRPMPALQMSAVARINNLG